MAASAMKKYLVAALVFVLTIVGLPQKTRAQGYSPYTYNNNAYLNYSIASSRARATRNRARPSRRRHHKRRVRHTRRVRRYSRN